MDTKLLRTFIIAGVLTLVSSTSNAQQGRSPKRPPSAEKIIERLDTDKDGKISNSEVKNDEKGHLKENFDNIDTNNDAYINKEELQVFINERKGSRKRKQ